MSVKSASSTPVLHAILSFALLCTLSASFASAVQFTSPADGATLSAGPVVFRWDESPVLFTVTGEPPTEISALETTVPLTPGTYEANVSNASNHTASISFTVTTAAANNTQTNQTNTTENSSQNGTGNTTTPTNQLITLSTDAALYEVGSSARIRVVVGAPESLTLHVAKTGGITDSYTVNVQQQTDFLYPLTATGEYIVTASGSGANASTTFSVRNTSLGVTITGDTDGTAGRVTSFGSSVVGGTSPFTYRWEFSDNTTSTGASVDHVFEAPGNYTVTLVVTDSTGKTASSNRAVEIEESLARLTVTIAGINSRLLPGSLVVISDSRSSRSAITDAYGSARFVNLPLGNYSVNGTFNDSTVTPIRTYNNTTTVALSRDRSVTLSLAVPDTRQPVTPPTVPVPTNTTNQTPTNGTNTTVVTPVPTPVPAAAPTTPPTASELSAAIDAEALAKAQTAESTTIVDTERIALTQARSDAVASLRANQASLLRSEVRAELVRTLGIDQRFTALEAEIAAATTPEQVAAVLARAPRDVTILSRDSTVTRRTSGEIAEDVEAYIAAVGADSEQASQIKYTAREVIQNMSIASKRSVVRVTRADGAAPETFTVFSREAEPIPGMTYIEVVPKSIANDVSALTIRGSHEVVEQDPIIRFLDSEYSYFVAGEAQGEPTVFALPSQLLTPTGLLGFVSVKLSVQSLERGGWYLGVLALVVFGVLGGNLYLRRRSSDPTQAFEELAELTLGVAEKGDFVTANKYLPELERIFQTLPAANQARSQETMSVLRQAVLADNFKRAEEALRATFQLQDHVATAAAYDRLLAAHAALPDTLRSQRTPALEAAHQALEAHLLKHEASQTQATSTTAGGVA